MPNKRKPDEPLEGEQTFSCGSGELGKIYWNLRDYLAEADAIIRGETMLLPQVEHLKALKALAASRQQILNKYITSLDEQIAQLKKWSGQ